MCLSAEADLVAGVVVGVIAVDGLRHVRRRSELPLASIPLALAGHQLVESLVWLGLKGKVDPSLWRPALYGYLVLAFGLLPVLVPVAVGALEPPEARRRMEWFTVVGIVVSFWLMYAVVKGRSSRPSRNATSTTSSTCGTGVSSWPCTSSPCAGRC